MSVAGRKFIVIGGAGFIGSHVVERLLQEKAAKVTVFDNFSSGRKWHLEHGRIQPRLRVMRGDVADLPVLANAMKGHDTVVHLASNPDIARAAKEPDIDFYHGTLLTQQVLEAMRHCGVKRLWYASGSGVYGERGEAAVAEDDGPFCPISTYGASKLAGEALIASYCAMFGMTANAFRFGNVVGARQTHGVGLDFLRRLRLEPERLRILGDGSQSKPYVHVSDAVSAMLLTDAKTEGGFAVFNVATADALRVEEIANNKASAAETKQAVQSLLDLVRAAETTPPGQKMDPNVKSVLNSAKVLQTKNRVVVTASIPDALLRAALTPVKTPPAAADAKPSAPPAAAKKPEKKKP